MPGWMLPLRGVDHCTIALPPACSWGDLNSVAALLRRVNPFRGVRLAGFDCYDGLQYVEARRTHGLSFSLVLDRNVFTRVVALWKDTSPRATEQDRNAAAVMAFATAWDIHFDGTVAVMEAAGGDDKVRRQETLGLAALQNVPARHYIAIALGRSQRLDPRSVECEMTQKMVDDVARLPFSSPGIFRPEYGAALKLGLLMLDAYPEMPTLRHMLEFLEWCYNDYMFSPGWLLYASLAMSPSRPAGMFKGLRNGDPDRARRGAWNAAWDMGLIRHWLQRALEDQREQEHVQLCSFDRAVRDCTADLVVENPEHRHIIRRNRWEREWGSKAGRELAHHYLKYELTCTTDPQRASIRYAHKRAHWSAFIDDLEQQFITRVKAISHT